MIRVQIQFTRSQYQRLKEEAAKGAVSIAQVVRDAVEAYSGEPEKSWDALLGVVGKYGRGASEDVGREHDRYLDEVYGDWREST
ncbi:MAG TPA: CopG family transcriptional regulator [Gemmatimonadota bacterium]|nr:CopG family transcriptional regulator [Gemmatimonadota bacterium]